MRDIGGLKTPCKSAVITRLVLKLKNLHFSFAIKKTLQRICFRTCGDYFFRGFGRQRRREFSAVVQAIERTTSPFLREYVLPAVKRVGVDLLEFVVLEVAEIVRSRKQFKTAAKSVEKQNLRKQLVSGSGNQKATIEVKQTSRVIPTKSAKHTTWLLTEVFANLSDSSCRTLFLVPTFCGSFWESWKKVPVIVNALLFHEQKTYPTISLDKNCIQFIFQTD